ncbi:MAG: GDSL-type esterase/lipase family protein [Planctomycetota bacterium]
MTRFYASFLVLALPPAIVLADLALAFARGYETGSSLWVAAVAICGPWLAVAVWQVSTRRRRESFLRRGPRFAALSVSLCLGWLLMELCLNAVFAPQLVFHLAPSHMKHKFHARPEFLRGVSPETNYTTNSQGVRGPEWPERSQAMRLLCIGGSTTECLFLDDRQTWPQQVAERLAADGGRPCWLGDVGRSGYATSDHLQLLENDALLNQLDGLIFLIGINDLQRAMKGRRLDVPFGLHPLYERSAVFRLIDQIHNTRRTRRRHMDETSDGSNYPLRRQQRAAARVVTSPPDLTAARAQYRRNLDVIADVCARHELRVWFATQPVLWRAGVTAKDEATFWLGVFEDGSKPLTAWLAQQMAAFNDVLRTFCRERKLGLIDLESLNGDPACFYDDCHFTIEGARRVADLVAAAVRER